METRAMLAALERIYNNPRLRAAAEGARIGVFVGSGISILRRFIEIPGNGILNRVDGFSLTLGSTLLGSFVGYIDRTVSDAFNEANGSLFVTVTSFFANPLTGMGRGAILGLALTTLNDFIRQPGTSSSLMMTLVPPALGGILGTINHYYMQDNGNPPAQNNRTAPPVKAA